MEEWKYKIGQIVKFKLTGEKVMILKLIPSAPLYNVHEGGYIVRLSNGLNELFVREFELGDL